ncbi:MAG: ABC transporter ATP-binding protein [Myxococcales bacterium]|nr:ABC transporter ATP-binding protein [Myxococcales bacterium]MCB9530616.1 ABC transporter ATP-binding protein [Myxococcales bacterium]
MSAPLLEVRDLVVSFATPHGRVRAVDGVSFHVAPRETVAIVGESGSGKSVTQLAILGLLPSPPARIESGGAQFDGRDLLALSPRELRGIRGRDVAMVFQDPMTSLNPFLTVGRQLEEVLEIHTKLGRRERRDRAIEALRSVGIAEPERRVDAHPHQMSGGMRQRVLIAMALICSPKLVIADEPTTALDVTVQAQVLELLQETTRAVGAAVVLISHDLGVVAGVADRVVVLYAGRVCESGPTRDVFHTPAHPYTRGLLDSVPRLDTHGERLVPIPGLPPDPARRPPGCPFAPRCALADDRCRVDAPALRPTSASAAHTFACHHSAAATTADETGEVGP